MRRAFLLLLGLLVACDPAGPPPLAGPGEDLPAAQDTERLGAPDEGLPQTIAGVRAQVRTTAQEWQDEPVLAEVDVELDGSRLTLVRLRYLAAGSERVLAIEVTDDGASQDRTTLSTLLGIPSDDDADVAVDDGGIAAVPPVPDGLLEPVALLDAAAEALAACDVEPTALRYATGAPWSWDGALWTQELAWTVTAIQATDDVSRFVALDPVSGAAVQSGCGSAG